MDKEKIALRQEAIRLLLNGETKSSIARKLGQSRLWVNKWANRYHPDFPVESLQDRSSAPIQPYREWSESVRQIVLNSRRERQEAKQPGYRFSLISAEAISYELCELGFQLVPSVRTIHDWLKQAGLVVRGRSEEKAERAAKPYPAPACQMTNDLHEVDLKGPFYLSSSPQKYYLIALRDACSKRVALSVAQNMQSETVIDFLMTAWKKLGLPKVLQMDNGLEFRGSNRYPRSLGKLVRVCLDLGVEPLFIPTHEPWRNGVVESLNGLLDRLFLEREYFDDFAHLQACAAEVEMAINTTHRLPALEGKTPTEFVQADTLRLLPENYLWRNRNLQLVKGKVSFIRLVRQSGRITLCVNDKFEIGTDYQWQYVFASVDVEAHRLDVFHLGQFIKSFDYV